MRPSLAISGAYWLFDSSTTVSRTCDVTSLLGLPVGYKHRDVRWGFGATVWMACAVNPNVHAQCISQRTLGCVRVRVHMCQYLRARVGCACQPRPRSSLIEYSRVPGVLIMCWQLCVCDMRCRVCGRLSLFFYPMLEQSDVAEEIVDNLEWCTDYLVVRKQTMAVGA